MEVREHIPLSQLTTLKVGGAARYVATCESVADVQAALAHARTHGVPYTVLGSGSNVLAADEGYEGVILLIRIPGLSMTKQGGGARITAGAGVLWDDVVALAAEKKLWGIENMAGIPGTIGAAPVQNIGAYGTELQTTLQEVTVLDTNTNEILTIANDACAFTYRDSRFKRERNLIILSVTLLLSRTGAPQTSYSDLAMLVTAGEVLTTPAQIGNAVRRVRTHKFPDLALYGTAGSFFKNPILSEAAYAALVVKYGPIPRYPAAHGVKIPLAFVLDHILGLKGYVEGKTHLFGNQPLVLVAEQGATAHDIDALANGIAQRVYGATGMSIEREVRSVPS